MIAALRDSACDQLRHAIAHAAAPGQKRLEGADASHAWISLWCGRLRLASTRPTNDLFVCDDHIVLAIGRDYADVSPIDA